MENKNLYPTPLLLLLLYITGGILYILASALVFTVMVAASRFIPVFREYAGSAFLVLIALGFLFAFVMTISIFMRRELFPFIPTRHVWMKYLVKLSQSVAKRAFLNPDKAVRSFITLNNEFIIKKILRKGAPERVLILLPHCIQLNSCAFKITSDIHNCRKCGKCVVADFIRLSERFGFDVFVSTGGTMARKVVVERRPDLILAVACERDLLSGIKDTLALPVLGVLNERPNGPCYNTTVSTEAVEGMLQRVFK